jgi:probable DNA metabolism protein
MEREAILFYDGSLQGFLSCVFTAYEEKLKVLAIKPVGEPPTGQLFLEPVEVITEPEKANRVWASLKKKSSAAGLRDLKWALLSELPDIELQLFRMLRYILAEDAPVDRDFSHPGCAKGFSNSQKGAPGKASDGGLCEV